MATYKTLVVGDIATCLPFGAMGVECLVAEETSDLSAELARRINSHEFGAIFIAEPFAQKLSDIIEKVRYRPLPSIILIPTVTGSLGMGREAVRETMKRAAGRDILGEE